MKRKKTPKNTYDLEYLKAGRRLSAREKLKYVSEFSEFLWKAMPKKSKKAWAELKKRGL